MSKKKKTLFGIPRKHLHTHLPTFRHMWHAKIDVHIFKIIFIGLFSIVIGVLIIIAMNAFTTQEVRTTTTRAGNDGAPQKLYRYYSPQYLKAWPAGDGRTWLWTTAVITNPYDTATEFTVNIYDSPYNEGAFQQTPLKTITQTVDAHTSFTFYGSDSWKNVTKNGQELSSAFGWVEVVSRGKPVVVFNRIIGKNGEDFRQSQMLFQNDTMFVYEQDLRPVAQYPLGIQRSGEEDRYRPFADLVMVNPSSQSITATVSLYSSEGELNSQISRQLAAGGVWYSWADLEWEEYEDITGWMEIRNTTPGGAGKAPVLSLVRNRIIDMQLPNMDTRYQARAEAYYKGNVYIEDMIATEADNISTRLYTPLSMTSPVADGDMTSWNEFSIVNTNTCDVSATITYTAVSDSGQPLPVAQPASVEVTIPSQGVYSSAADETWETVLDTASAEQQNGTMGWVEVQADAAGLVAVAQTNTTSQFRTGDDETELNLVPQKQDRWYFIPESDLSSKHYIPMYLRDWPAESYQGMQAYQQGSVVMVNPSAIPSQANFRMFDFFSGSENHTIRAEIDPYGVFDGVQDSGWRSVPKTNEIVDMSYTSVDIETSRPVFGLYRFWLEDSDGSLLQTDVGTEILASPASIGGCTADTDCAESEYCPLVSDIPRQETAYVCTPVVQPTIVPLDEQSGLE